MQTNAVVQSRVLATLQRAMGPTVLLALEAPEIVEVIVNADGRIWVDAVGRGLVDTGETLPLGAVETVIRLVADAVGEVVDRHHPTISGVLPETGERFQGTIPPVSAAPEFCIRKRPGVIFGLADYIRDGILTSNQALVLATAVACRRNILVAGGTGSGKTTLCNALLAEAPFTASRVVILEDTTELQCAAPNKTVWLTKQTAPPVTMTHLLKNALRVRPDHIVVGEVRDGAALDLIMAWNTGHPGGISTVHANSAEDALYRLEDLVGLVSTTVPRRSIAAAIQMIVFIAKTAAGRRVEQIVRCTGHRDGHYILEHAL